MMTDFRKRWAFGGFCRYAAMRLDIRLSAIDIFAFGKFDMRFARENGSSGTSTPTVLGGDLVDMRFARKDEEF